MRDDELRRALDALDAGFAPLLRLAHVPFADPAALVLGGLEDFIETVTAIVGIDDEVDTYRTEDREALRMVAKRLKLDPEALQRRIDRLYARAGEVRPTRKLTEPAYSSTNHQRRARA